MGRKVGVCGRGGMHGGGACVGGVHGRGVHGGGASMAGGMHATHAPSGHYEIWSVNAQSVRILLECILVYLIFLSSWML